MNVTDNKESIKEHNGLNGSLKWVMGVTMGALWILLQAAYGVMYWDIRTAIREHKEDLDEITIRQSIALTERKYFNDDINKRLTMLEGKFASVETRLETRLETRVK